MILALPRRILYLMAVGLLIIAGISVFNLVHVPGPGPVHASIRLLHGNHLLAIGPIVQTERDRYTSILKTWAVEQGFDPTAVATQDSDVVLRGNLAQNVHGPWVIDLDLTSIPELDRIQLSTSPLVDVTTDASQMRSLTESTYQSTGSRFSAVIDVSLRPFYFLLFTYAGLLVLGWLFAWLVCRLGQPSQWTDSRFTLYTTLAYLPAIGLLTMFTLGGYLSYLPLIMSPLASYGFTMTLITTLIVVPGIPLWRARYQGQDSISILPGWAAMLTLPPFLASTIHLCVALWMPIGVSMFWWVPVDGMILVLSLVHVAALAPVLLGVRGWADAPAGMFHRAWVVPGGKGGWANAFVMGIDPSRSNLFVTERLLEELTPGELAAVLAHEHGHVVLGHLWKLPTLFLAMNLGVESLLIALPMWLNSPIINDYGILLAPILVYFGTVPILMAVSRRFERAADAWACRQLGGDAIHLGDALSKLRHLNGGRRNRFLRWWASHPSIEERITAIRARASGSSCNGRQVEIPQ